MEGSALYLVRAWAEEFLEAGGDFAGCLVSEGEGADAGWIYPLVLDEEPDPLDQAECLAGSRACEDKYRAQVRLDRGALRVRGGMWRVRGVSDWRGEILDCG